MRDLGLERGFSKHCAFPTFQALVASEEACFEMNLISVYPVFCCALALLV